MYFVELEVGHRLDFLAKVANTEGNKIEQKHRWSNAKREKRRKRGHRFSSSLWNLLLYNQNQRKIQDFLPIPITITLTFEFQSFPGKKARIFNISLFEKKTLSKFLL